MPKSTLFPLPLLGLDPAFLVFLIESDNFLVALVVDWRSKAEKSHLRTVAKYAIFKSNSGSIKLFDQELSQLSSHQLDRFRKNNIGIVFQRSHFVNSLTVKENLQLAQYIANKKDNNRIESILKKLNIFDKSNKKTNQLSQGEKQRASIALAIVNSPKLILADEPTSSLDDTNCSKVIKLLKKQATDFGAQLIVITHDSRLKKHFKKSIEL